MEEGLCEVKKRTLIIFDMDGVLVDVSSSYREVVRRTVVEYMRQVLGADVSDGFITLADIAAVKKSGGLNNDWDLTDAILNTYLLHGLPQHDKEPPERLYGSVSTEDEHTRLERINRVDLSRTLPALEKLVAEKPVTTLFSSSQWERGKRSQFLLNEGDVGSGNLSKRIFQELYLGPTLFREHYGEDCMFYTGDGFINHERSIPRNSELDALQKAHILAIATGRPGAEAHYALRRFNMERYFAATISEDDVAEFEGVYDESLRKPHPFSLALCMERCGYGNGDKVYYVGDMPDDMRAATRAGVHAVGFVDRENGEKAEQRDEHMALLAHHGAEQVFTTFGELGTFMSRK
jgi:HAD superfamily hydrolase (TIGR01548 family)